jgi:pimeloyl-ACP methyl ester carboxylesterase
VATFALVHGAYHGGACWDLLIPELEARGHDAIAMDLPAPDPAAGVNEYADTVITALKGAGNEVTLLGHSMGGLTIPLVADRRPVRRLVFLAAMLSEPGGTGGDVLARHPDAINPVMATAGVDNGDGTASMPDDLAAEVFYHDCPPDIAAWAVSVLRPQAWKVVADPLPVDAWPSVPQTYIACREDRTLTYAFQRALASERGMDLVELPGGHSPFLSRPAALADILTAL